MFEHMWRKLSRFISRITLAVYSRIILGRKVSCYGIFKVLRSENVSVGVDCHINYGVFILGHSRVRIGDRVTLSARSMIIDAGLDIHSEVGTRSHFDSFVIIQDDVWVGAGAIILPGVTLGKGSVIGAGSVVTKDIPEYCVAVGNPARVIKRLCSRS